MGSMYSQGDLKEGGCRIRIREDHVIMEAKLERKFG